MACIAAGGFIVNIDLTTGALDDIAKSKAKPGRLGVETRPMSESRFGGVVLPYWSERKLPVSSAARCLRPLRALGWDVVIANDGRILLEANDDYDMFLHQEAVGGMRNTPIGRVIVDELNCFRV
ncbi:MAG: hypothetical protein E4H01_05140 [Lysobacterales bacterium]|nr:MAG: hypothetical protein E4H01_05140 [Xanthomonadales bacterium]